MVGIEAAARASMKAVALTTTLDGREFQNLYTVIQVAKEFTSLECGAHFQPA